MRSGARAGQNLLRHRFYFFFFNFFLFLPALGLRCCARLSLVVVSGGYSCCGAWALGVLASVVVARGLSSCGSRTLEPRLSSCGTGAQLLCGMWGLPGPGPEAVSPALAGRFLTTMPPGKPSDSTS